MKYVLQYVYSHYMKCKINFLACICILYLYRVGQIPFSLEKCFKKKLLNIFSNFFFYLKAQSFRLIMESNFIQMAASAGRAVAYTSGTIFKHIIDCKHLYFNNSFTNIVLLSVNYLWLVGVTLIFDGTAQMIVNQC